jgi:hypothetical protein
MKTFKEFIKEAANNSTLGIIKSKGFVPHGFVAPIIPGKPKKK